MGTKIKLIIVIFFNLLIFFFPTYGQNLDDIIRPFNEETILDKQFNFKGIELEKTDKEKFDKFIEIAIILDTNTVYSYTGFKSLDQLIKAKDSLITNQDEIYKKIVRNFHFIDIDNDDDIDFLYDELDFQDDFNFTDLYINEGSSYKKVKIPGFFITDAIFSNGKMILKTFIPACCEDPFETYSKFEFTRNYETKTIYALAIITSGKIPKKLKLNKEIIIIPDSILLKQNPQNKTKTHGTKLVTFYSGQRGKIFSKEVVEGKIWYFVELSPIEIEFRGIIYNKIWGWLKEDEVQIK